MTDSTTPDTAAGGTIAPPPGWRFRLGVVFFALAIISPLGAAIVAMTDLPMAAKATLSGLFLAGFPEVFTVVAIALLGKEGFAYVKNRLLTVLRRYGPPKEVGRARYYVGLTMLFLPAVLTWPIVYAPDWIPGYAEYRIPINLTLDFLFICSFFVLGGEFWDKLRALFIHKATAGFPEPAEA